MRKEKSWQFNSLLAADKVLEIRRGLSYLSEYVMNHWPDDSIIHPGQYIRDLHGMQAEIKILLSQFKMREQERRKNGKRG